ncbi:hypothetical protein [Halomarina rubra]|uniref:Uncharacterized protein n=1 Tax=Halomarina rubra TaxID=2071873 RepID=A0ABD6AWW6_9EURY|nr:hypothetical protein [Halomarina rubra]
MSHVVDVRQEDPDEDDEEARERVGAARSPSTSLPDTRSGGDDPVR